MSIRGGPNDRRRMKITKEKKIVVCTVEFDGEMKPNKPLYFPGKFIFVY